MYNPARIPLHGPHSLVSFLHHTDHLKCPHNRRLFSSQLKPIYILLMSASSLQMYLYVARFGERITELAYAGYTQSVCAVANNYL